MSEFYYICIDRCCPRNYFTEFLYLFNGNPRLLNKIFSKKNNKDCLQFMKNEVLIYF